MKATLCAAMIAATLLSACATDGPATGGASVRALMASQIMPAQPHAARGADGADGMSAAAAYANYKQSYVTPAPQGDSTLVGSRK